MSGRIAACSALVLCLALAVAGNVRAGSPIPGNLPIKEKGYEPGVGESIGTVVRAEGAAVIVHAGGRVGYRARSGRRLFRDDMLMTGEDGKLRLRLTDGSVITLSGGSKLELSRHVFDPGSGTRSSFLDMVLGRIRYVIRELSGYKRSEFRIRTPTAIAGIRGSDFVIEAQRSLTRVTALKDTELVVFGLAHPDKPHRITDYTRVRVEPGRPPGKPSAVSPEEVRRLKRGFRFEGRRKGAVPPPDSGTGKQQESVSGLKGGSAFPPAREGPSGIPAVHEGHVPAEDLVLPEEAAVVRPPGHGGQVPGHLRRLQEHQKRGDIRQGHERNKEAKKDRKAKKDKDIKPDLPDPAVGP